MARERKPSIIFIDEVDSLCSSREGLCEVRRGYCAHLIIPVSRWLWVEQRLDVSHQDGVSCANAGCWQGSGWGSVCFCFVFLFSFNELNFGRFLFSEQRIFLGVSILQFDVVLSEESTFLSQVKVKKIGRKKKRCQLKVIFPHSRESRDFQGDFSAFVLLSLS